MILVPLCNHHLYSLEPEQIDSTGPMCEEKDCPICIGDARQSCKQDHYRDSMRMYENPSEEHRIGAIGERAFEIKTGLPMCREQRPGGDAGIDFTAPSGCRIDVKSRRAPIGQVKVKDLERKVDTYVFIHQILWNKVELLGWLREDQVRKFPVKDTPYGPVHQIPRNNLMHLDLLCLSYDHHGLSCRCSRCHDDILAVSEGIG